MNYIRSIRKLLHEMYEASITRECVWMINDILLNILSEIVSYSNALIRHSNRKTLTDTILNQSIQLLFDKDYVRSIHQSIQFSEQIFPQVVCKQRVQSQCQIETIITKKYVLNLTLTLQYVAADLLELCYIQAHKADTNRISSVHLIHSIHRDYALYRLYSKLKLVLIPARSVQDPLLQPLAFHPSIRFQQDALQVLDKFLRYS